MNRQLRTRFSALKFTDIKQQVKVFQDNMEQAPKFKQNDAVFAKNFGKGQDWMPGVVTYVLSTEFSSTGKRCGMEKTCGPIKT